MSRWVVDASVAIKWFLIEPQFEAAARLLDDKNSLACPDLLFCEVGNALWKRVRRGDLSQDEGHSMLNALTRARIEVHVCSSSQLLALAFQVALETKASFYDSTYVSLATLIGWPLVTADRKLLERLAGTSYARLLCWVEDVP